jgi:hypothetical protein
MPEIFKLRPPQIPMVEFARMVPRCGLWADMGIGKTSGIIFLLDMLNLMGELDWRNPTLVVAPARVAKDTWSDEIVKWSNFKDIRILPICGTPDERLKKIKQRAEIYTVSYELAPQLVEYWLAKWPYRIVVADELERLKGFREKSHYEKRYQGGGVGSNKTGSSGVRAHALSRIAHNFTDRWINLGGTPAPAGLQDLWGSTWFLDRGERLGRTFGDFERRWFRLKWSGTGIEPLPFAEAQIHEAIKDICITIDPADYYDLKKPIPNTIDVHLPPKAMAMYKKLERDMFVELASGVRVNAVTAGVLTGKCLQLANGAMYTENPAWELVHNAKLEALESVISEAGSNPLLIQTSFVSDKTRILARFRKAVDIATPKGLKAFKAGISGVGVAHPGSMGHGIDGLQYVTNRLVRFGHVWKLSETMQYLARIGPMRQFNAGLDRPVFVTDIVAKDTLDEDVIESHVHNRSVQDALLLAANRYRQR